MGIFYPIRKGMEGRKMKYHYWLLTDVGVSSPCTM